MSGNPSDSVRFTCANTPFVKGTVGQAYFVALQNKVVLTISLAYNNALQSKVVLTISLAYNALRGDRDQLLHFSPPSSRTPSNLSSYAPLRLLQIHARCSLLLTNVYVTGTLRRCATYARTRAPHKHCIHKWAFLAHPAGEHIAFPRCRVNACRLRAQLSRRAHAHVPICYYSALECMLLRRTLTQGHAQLLLLTHALETTPAHAATRASSRTAHAHVKPYRTAHDHSKLHPARRIAAPHTHAEPTRTRTPIRCTPRAQAQLCAARGCTQ
eukprot:3505128-Pleurochrysis_carterae.AAC.2